MRRAAALRPKAPAARRAAAADAESRGANAPASPWSDRARPAPPSRRRSTAAARPPPRAYAPAASCPCRERRGGGRPPRRGPPPARRGHCAGHCTCCRSRSAGPRAGPRAPRLPSPRGHRSAVPAAGGLSATARAGGGGRVRRRLPAAPSPAAAHRRGMDLRPRRAWARARVRRARGRRAQGGGARPGMAPRVGGARRAGRSARAAAGAARPAARSRSTVRPPGASARERDERGERGVQVLLIVAGAPPGRSARAPASSMRSTLRAPWPAPARARGCDAPASASAAGVRAPRPSSAAGGARLAARAPLRLKSRAAAPRRGRARTFTPTDTVRRIAAAPAGSRRPRPSQQPPSLLAPTQCSQCLLSVEESECFYRCSSHYGGAGTGQIFMSHHANRSSRSVTCSPSGFSRTERAE